MSGSSIPEASSNCPAEAPGLAVGEVESVLGRGFGSPLAKA